MKCGNILLVANYESNVGFAWWSMENFWGQISRYFSERGRRIFLIYPKITNIPEPIKKQPITVLQHDFSDRSKQALANLKSIIRENRISSLYLTDRPYYSTLYMMLRKWGIRRIVMHDRTPGERSPVEWWKRVFKKSVYYMPGMSCDLYLGVSRFVYKRFLENVCIPRNRCKYVLNGIVPIEIEERNRYLVHDEFGFPRNAKVIVSTGRATFYKGIDFIVNCAERMIKQHRLKNVYFLHCGDGPNLIDFKRMVTERGISERFFFAGRRSDVRQLLQSCDIGFQASKGEAFSLSILEYMSAGLAAVVPDHCGNNEAIINNENGMLYKPGDLQIALQILTELVYNHEKRVTIGKKAIATVKEQFDIRRTNQELIECLKGCL